MVNKKIRILALAACLFSLALLFLLLSAISPVKAGPPLQEPQEGEQPPPVEPFEPAVFPEGPDEDEEMAAQGGVQPAAYIVNPTMNYQGYLADSGGNPINATLTFTASLYDDTSAGILMWGPEVHPGVQVQNGLFHLALGQSVPLDPAIFYNALYLELGVDGTTLPRQTLRTVPYAFSLVPGAYVRGDVDANALVRFQNDGDDFALWAEEIGSTDYGLGADKIYSEEGYASAADSYLWVPGSLAVMSDTNTTLAPEYYGRVKVQKSDVGQANLHIPIALFTSLYGHDVVVEDVRVYYYTTNASTYISSTHVYKLKSASSHERIGYTNVNQNSTAADDYSVPIDATSNYTLTSTSGPLSIDMYIHFDDTSHSVYIGGVRVRLGHPRNDGL